MGTLLLDGWTAKVALALQLVVVVILGYAGCCRRCGVRLDFAFYSGIPPPEEESKLK